MKLTVKNPYPNDVHLDAGVYDGLYKKVFAEAVEVCQKEHDREMERLASLSPEKVREEVRREFCAVCFECSATWGMEGVYPNAESCFIGSGCQRSINRTNQILSIVNAQFQLEEGQALAVVERESELPQRLVHFSKMQDFHWFPFSGKEADAQQDMLKAGYTHKVVRIIGGKDG